MLKINRYKIIDASDCENQYIMRFSSSDSKDLITYDEQGKIICVSDAPKKDKYIDLNCTKSICVAIRYYILPKESHPNECSKGFSLAVPMDYMGYFNNVKEVKEKLKNFILSLFDISEAKEIINKEDE